VHKTFATSALVCGLVAAAIPLAGRASAYCDSVDCVPNVARGVAAGAPCTPAPGYDFGIDAANNTLICASYGTWVPVGPLIGEREVSQPCDRVGDTAQQPLAGNDLQLMRTRGVPLRCAAVNNALRWVNF
jgi:hypothetical protein